MAKRAVEIEKLTQSLLPKELGRTWVNLLLGKTLIFKNFKNLMKNTLLEKIPKIAWTSQDNRKIHLNIRENSMKLSSQSLCFRKRVNLFTLFQMNSHSIVESHSSQGWVQIFMWTNLDFCQTMHLSQKFKYKHYQLKNNLCQYLLVDFQTCMSHIPICIIMDSDMSIDWLNLTLQLLF